MAGQKFEWDLENQLGSESITMLDQAPVLHGGGLSDGDVHVVDIPNGK